MFLNAGSTIDESLAVTLKSIFEGLKQRGMLGKLRELFNFMNTSRDSTCTDSDFKQLLAKLDVKSNVDSLVPRYQSQPGRVDFSKFLRDMEFCGMGLSPALVWAIDLAADIVKCLVVRGFSSPEQLL